MDDLYGSLLPKDSISEWSSDIPKPSQDEKKKRTNSDMESAKNEEIVPSNSNTNTVKSHIAFKPMSIKRPPVMFKPNAVVSKPVNSTPKVETIQVSASNNKVNTVSENNISDDDEDSRNNTFDVSDPYDPSRPNDYNQYCIEREEKKRLTKLAEQNSLYIQEMETQRKEKEFQRIAAAERGDVQKLQELDNSRGRGRGLSNLPAWMTTKNE